jgi:MFS family permease
MQVPAGLLGDRFGRKRVLFFVAPFVTGWSKDWSGSFAGGSYWRR